MSFESTRSSPSNVTARSPLAGTAQSLHQALNHDFCPWVNRWVYWLKNPFWCLILAVLLSLICGLFVNPSAFIVTGILGMLAGAGVFLPWLTVRGLECHIRFDHRRGRVGKMSIVRLQIRNRWPWPAWGLSLIRGFSLKASHESSEGISLAKVPAWSTVEYSWPFVPASRGHYPLCAPELETAFPFGLFRFGRRAEVDGRLIVWPATVDLAGLPDTEETRGDDSLAERRADDFGDMLGTRPFREGDSLRRIHWAQTARQRQLIVCERQAMETTSVVVYVDLDPASHIEWDADNRHSEDSLELVIGTAASICESLHEQHCRVELVVGEEHFVAGSSATGFQNLMYRLATANLQSQPRLRISRKGSSGFGIAVTTTAGQRWRGSQLHGLHVVVLATGPTASTQEDRVSTGWIQLDVGTDRTQLGADWSRSDWASQLSSRWKGACGAR
ncbi:MAG: DUF58 domain-containing protein [Planctomycetaceae bacterium]